MSTTFGERSFMEALLELEQDDEIPDPIRAITAKTSLSVMTIQKYIYSLEAREYIRYIRGNRSRPGLIKILKNDPRGLDEIPPVVGRTLPREPAKMPEPVAAPTPLPKETPTEKPKLPRVAVLLDYDNIAIGAASAKIEVSWARLKERARKYGRLVFADAYLSPSATEPRIIRELANTGWRPVYCPLRYKDKDSVDYAMTADARKYLTEDFADIVIIASRDADFKGLDDFASDQRKMVVFLEINDAREASPIPVTVPAPTPKSDPALLEDDREKYIFGSALELAIKGKRIGPYAGPSQIGFIRFLLNASSRVSILEIKGFDEFANKVWDEMRPNWGRSFTLSQTQTALKVLLDKKALVMEGGAIKPNSESLAVKVILDPAQ